jgi:anti-sigma factor RsiW
MRDDADLTLDAGDPPARKRPARIRHVHLTALSLHIDGALGDREGNETDDHLASCPTCSQDFAELRTTVLLLRGLPQYEPRRSFVLEPGYARVKRRSLPPVEEHPAAATQMPLPANSGWHNRLLPSTGSLRIASGLVGVALIAALAGDALIADPSPQAMGLRTDLLATSIQQPVTTVRQPAPAPGEPLPLVPASAAEFAGTEGGAPALQEADGAPVAATATAAPSPWRVAQIGLAMLLLWLLVSLGGRLWMDRHERMPG